VVDATVDGLVVRGAELSDDVGPGCCGAELAVRAVDCEWGRDTDRVGRDGELPL
jgi:hypothetical protein